MIQTFNEYLLEKESGAESQIVFYNTLKDSVPLKIKTFSTRLEAEKFAKTCEVKYSAKTYDANKKDFIKEDFFKFHNPEDNLVYVGYEIQKLK